MWVQSKRRCKSHESCVCIVGPWKRKASSSKHHRGTLQHQEEQQYCGCPYKRLCTIPFFPDYVFLKPSPCFQVNGILTKNHSVFKTELIPYLLSFEKVSKDGLHLSTVFFLFFFFCFGPYIWNSLPQDLRHCSTLSSFKAKVKTFLFSQYFHPN